MARCGDNARSRNAFYQAQAKRGEKTALKLVKRYAFSQEPPIVVHDADVTPDFYNASKELPFFCPGEYTVANGGGNPQTAPQWHVDITTGMVRKLYTMAQLLAEVQKEHSPRPGSDADRIALCMNGKPPVDLNPATLPNQ